MAKRAMNPQTFSEPDPVVRYFPETQSLWIDSGKQLGEGETIAKGVVVFYNKGDDTLAEGVRIEFAEQVLKPFVDTIIAKYGAKPKQSDGAATKGAQIQAIVQTLRRGPAPRSSRHSVPVPRLFDD